MDHIRGDATLLYDSQATRDARARVKSTSVSLQTKWRPKAGWGVLLAWVTLCIVWSSTWLAIKIGLRDLPPISFVAIRFLIAIIVLLAVSMGRTHLLPRTRNDYVVLAATGILMFTVNYTLLFWAELHVSSGLAAVLQATIPIFGMMFAHWMLPNEPLRLPKLAGAIIALAGVTLICARLLGFNGPLAFWGGVGVVVGAASAAFANVLVKARSMQLSPAMLAAWQMIFGTVPLLLLGFIVDGNPVRFHWTPSSVFCLLYLAVIGSALTFLLLYWLLPRLTVAQLQSISLITPPGAVMLGWLLGGETFPLSSLFGAGLVLAGVWMIFRKASVPEPLIQEG
ncbi:MAG TPA: EamA family transporter [Candidatus Tectomicrobia bacterium]|nr:EamA family transporter [Candidatus Tectomicrobia bacterium]